MIVYEWMMNLREREREKELKPTVYWELVYVWDTSHRIEFHSHNEKDKAYQVQHNKF